MIYLTFLRVTVWQRRSEKICYLIHSVSCFSCHKLSYCIFNLILTYIFLLTTAISAYILRYSNLSSIQRRLVKYATCTRMMLYDCMMLFYGRSQVFLTDSEKLRDQCEEKCYRKSTQHSIISGEIISSNNWPLSTT